MNNSSFTAEDIKKEAQRYGRHADRVMSFLSAAGCAGMELSRTGGETLCVLLAYRLCGFPGSEEIDFERRAQEAARKKRKLIARDLGLPAGRGTVKILAKVAYKDLELDQDLDFLRSALQDPHSCRLLAHLPAVSSEVIRILGRKDRRGVATYSLLEDFLRCFSGDSFNHMLNGPIGSAGHAIRLMDAYLELWQLLYPDCCPPKIRTIAEIPAKHGTLMADHSAWERMKARYLPFPDPPVRGSKYIQPIRTAIDLIAEGEECRTCIGSRAAEVAAGKAYAYRITAPERGTLMLKKSEGRWTLDEARGLDDRTIARNTLVVIHAWLEGEKQQQENDSVLHEVSLEDLTRRIIEGTSFDEIFEINELDEPDEEKQTDICEYSSLPLTPIRASVKKWFRFMEESGSEPGQRFSDMLGVHGLPVLDDNTPFEPSSGSLVLLHGADSDGVLRDYAAYGAVKSAIGGHPTLLLDPFATNDEQAERLLKVWGGVEQDEIDQKSFSEKNWLSLTSAAAVMCRIPLVLSTMRGIGLDLLKKTIRKWRASAVGEQQVAVPVVLVTGADHLFSTGLKNGPESRAVVIQIKSLIERLWKTALDNGVFMVLLADADIGSDAADILKDSPLNLNVSFKRDPQVCLRVTGEDPILYCVTAAHPGGVDPKTAWIGWDPQTGAIIEMPASQK